MEGQQRGVDVRVTLRTGGMNDLAFALRRLAAQAEARAIEALHRSWMLKSQAAADRYRERIAEHESLAVAARTVADALDNARRTRERENPGRQ